MYSFEEALTEIIVGRVVYDDDRHKMALYAIQQFRTLKIYLSKEKHHEMSQLIIAFNLDKLNSDEFETKSMELKSRA